jgi:hypothetical protein
MLLQLPPLLAPPRFSCADRYRVQRWSELVNVSSYLNRGFKLPKPNPYDNEKDDGEKDDPAL